MNNLYNYILIFWVYKVYCVESILAVQAEIAIW